MVLLSSWGLGVFSAVQAHYTMLLPDPPLAQRGQSVTVYYQWGHAFEHQLFDAPAPQQVVVLTPGGARQDLTRLLEAVSLAGEKGQQVRAWRLRYVPPQRGDYVLLASGPPIWMPEERLFYQDTVRVVIHVQDQQGWDTWGKQEWELLPLTRPYGLQPGMVFQAQLLAAGKPAAGQLVEIEPYHAAPPRRLPAEEHMTRTAKTDPNGVVTCTLTEAGWWGLTAGRLAGELPYQGKNYPLRQRTTLWVYVEEPAVNGR